jgi:hypothetical protein
VRILSDIPHERTEDALRYLKTKGHAEMNPQQVKYALQDAKTPSQIVMSLSKFLSLATSKEGDKVSTIAGLRKWLLEISRLLD